jgi:hypothetical protein
MVFRAGARREPIIDQFEKTDIFAGHFLKNAMPTAALAESRRVMILTAPTNFPLAIEESTATAFRDGGLTT